MKKTIAVFITFVVMSIFSAISQMVTTYEGEMGHAVAFDVARFTDVCDKTLSDVLAKMPGVSGGMSGRASADFKAEYQFTDCWQVIASTTNILKRKDYAYKIRQRNSLLNLYYKF